MLARRKYETEPLSPRGHGAMVEALRVAVNDGHATFEQMLKITGTSEAELRNLLDSAGL